MIHLGTPHAGRYRTGRAVNEPLLRINEDSPEADGLLACYVADRGGMINLIDGAVGARLGSVDPMRGAETGALDAFFDGIDDGYDFGAAGIADTANPLTIVWEALLDSFNDAFPMIATFARGVTNAPLELFYSNNAAYDDITFGIANGGSSNRVAALRPSGVAVAGERHWGVWSYLGGTISSGANHNVWLNGQLCSAATASTLGAITDQTAIGKSSGSTADWNGSIRQVRLYNRAWSEAGAIRFWHPSTRDQLFSSRRRQTYWFMPAAAGTVHDVALTLTANAGAQNSVAADYSVSMSLPAAVSASGSPAADYSAALTMAVQQALSTQAGQDVAAAVALAVSAASSAAATIDLGALLTLTHALGVTADTQWEANAQIALPGVLGIAIAAQALLNVGVALSSILSITTDGSALVITVSAPAERVLTIRVEGRTLTVRSEQRTSTIAPENRRLLH